MGIGRLIRVALALLILATGTGFRPVAAAGTTSASVTMSASVASMIVPDVIRSSPNCHLIPVGHGAAWCVMITPLTIRVRSNERWTGFLAGRTRVGNSWSNPSLHCGGFRFRTPWDIAFALPLVWPGETWIRTGAIGTTTYSWYLAVFVANVSKISQVTTSLKFTVAQRTSGLAYTLTIPLTWHPV